MSFLQKGVPLLLIEYCELSYCEGFEVIVLRVQTTTGSYLKPLLLYARSNSGSYHRPLLLCTPFMFRDVHSDTQIQ